MSQISTIYDETIKKLMKKTSVKTQDFMEKNPKLVEKHINNTVFQLKKLFW